MYLGGDVRNNLVALLAFLISPLAVYCHVLVHVVIHVILLPVRGGHLQLRE
jgi:hypothetical protein